MRGCVASGDWGRAGHAGEAGRWESARPLTFVTLRSSTNLCAPHPAAMERDEAGHPVDTVESSHGWGPRWERGQGRPTLPYRWTCAGHDGTVFNKQIFPTDG